MPGVNPVVIVTAAGSAAVSGLYCWQFPGPGADEARCF